MPPKAKNLADTLDLKKSKAVVSAPEVQVYVPVPTLASVPIPTSVELSFPYSLCP